MKIRLEARELVSIKARGRRKGLQTSNMNVIRPERRYE